MAERKWTKVNSSRLDSVDYDPTSRTLYVRFPANKDGVHSVYGYANCTPSQYQEMLNAPSIGKAFNSQFANQKQAHPYARLEPEQAQEPEEPTAA